MQTLERLSASDLVTAIAAYRDTLRAHQERINRLNVYPVPDGDTGTNMALTLESVVKEIGDRDASDMATVSQAISYGSLMGARGNSGVILSQILRGLAEAARDCDGVDAVVLIDGLGRAAEGAYRAVQHPVEGTILTVAKAASEGAAAAGAAQGLLPVLVAAKSAADEALRRTPEMLPVLKAAGVVDSGGSGLVLMLDALLHVADGRPLPEPPAAGELAGSDVSVAGEADTSGSGEDDESGLRYEVMFFLEAPDELVPAFREVWAGIGDSIVVVGGDGLWNCHIHTDDIGSAVEAALDAGRPRKIRVSDLWEEVEEERWVRDASRAGLDEEPQEESVVCAAVAVCTGDGIRRIFRSLGVHHFVSGGQ